MLNSNGYFNRSFLEWSNLFISCIVTEHIPICLGFRAFPNIGQAHHFAKYAAKKTWRNRMSILVITCLDTARLDTDLFSPLKIKIWMKQYHVFPKKYIVLTINHRLIRSHLIIYPDGNLVFQLVQTDKNLSMQWISPYTYICLYIERERQGEGEREKGGGVGGWREGTGVIVRY